MIENLEWCTNSENQLHARKHALIVAPKGKDHYAYGIKKPLTTPISVITDNLDCVQTFYYSKDINGFLHNKGYKGRYAYKNVINYLKQGKHRIYGEDWRWFHHD